MPAEQIGFETTSDHHMVDITIQHAKKWQEFFDNLMDVSQIDEFRRQAAAELDGMYPYLGRPVFISGNGLRPVLDEESMDPLGEEYGYGPGVLGQHNGFSVMQMATAQDTIYYKVMQQIYVGTRAGMVRATVHQQLKYFEYYDLDSSCLVADELNDVFYGETGDKPEHGLDDQINVVYEQSENMMTLLRSRSFKRLGQDSQRRRLDALIAQTEQESKLRGAELLAEAEYGYVNMMAGNMHIIPINISNSVVGGECLGLESLESLALRMRAIKKVTDLVDRYAGICLVLDPDADTRQGLNLSASQVLYLPVRQNIELEKVGC